MFVGIEIALFIPKLFGLFFYNEWAFVLGRNCKTSCLLQHRHLLVKQTFLHRLQMTTFFLYERKYADYKRAKEKNNFSIGYPYKEKVRRAYNVQTAITLKKNY